MPKIYETKTSPGCRVSGQWTQADGTPVAGRKVILRPQSSGVWRGRVISRDAVVVTTDADGGFVVTLAPSIAVGLYEVSMDKVRLAVDVPDAESAELAAIVAR